MGGVLAERRRKIATPLSWDMMVEAWRSVGRSSGGLRQAEKQHVVGGGVGGGLVWAAVWCGRRFGVGGGLVWAAVWCERRFGVGGGLVWEAAAAGGLSSITPCGSKCWYVLESVCGVHHTRTTRPPPSLPSFPPSPPTPSPPVPHLSSCHGSSPSDTR